MVAKHTMWDKDGVHVWAERTWAGDLTISGQHLMEGVEYEYAITISSEDVHRIAEALGCPFNLVFPALRDKFPQILAAGGELTWLNSLGVQPKMWSRYEE